MKNTYSCYWTNLLLGFTDALPCPSGDTDIHANRIGNKVRQALLLAYTVRNTRQLSTLLFTWIPLTFRLTAFYVNEVQGWLSKKQRNTKNLGCGLLHATR